MYNTRCCQQFVVSMEGEPPWSRVRDLFPSLLGRALQVVRLQAELVPDRGSASIDAACLFAELMMTRHLHPRVVRI